MTVLLAHDRVELFTAGDLDAHGWRETGEARAYWCGAGNLQLAPSPSDPRAAEGGGHGPHDPHAVPTGTLYLPTGACPAEGVTALVRGQAWVLSQVRMQKDPADLGGFLDCWTATATAVPDGS